MGQLSSHAEVSGPSKEERVNGEEIAVTGMSLVKYRWSMCSGYDCENDWVGGAIEQKNSPRNRSRELGQRGWGRVGSYRDLQIRSQEQAAETRLGSHSRKQHSGSGL